MAKGRTHDKINLFLGALITGTFLGLTFDLPLAGCFLGGWLFSTFIFSPDTDLMPKKRTKFLQFFLYPYSILFRHRGISHSFLFGTLTRIIYGLVIITLSFYVLEKMNFVSYGSEDFLSSLYLFAIEFSLEIRGYQFVTGIFLGMFGADLGHILVDKISGYLPKI